MAFSILQEIYDAQKNGMEQNYDFHKVGLTSQVTGGLTRLWRANYMPVPAPAEPPTLIGEVPTKDTVGAIPIINAESGKTLYLKTFGVAGTSGGTVILYDRIWHCGGISLATTNTQSLGGVLSPTRYSDGWFNELFIEVTVAVTTAVNLTINYIGVADNALQATVSIPASASLNRVFPVTLAAGSRGVKSVQSVTCDVVSSGTVNLVMFNGSMFYPLSFENGQSLERDTVLQSTTLPIIKNDACLTLMILSVSTTSGTFNGRVVITEG